MIDRIQIENIKMKLDNFKQSKENETTFLDTDGKICSLKYKNIDLSKLKTVKVKIEKLNINLLNKKEVYDEKVVNAKQIIKNKYKSKNDENVIEETKKIFI